MSQRIRFIPLLPWLGSALRLLAALTLALLAIPLTPTVPAAAGAWYVAPTGNDSAACTTSAAPCRTIGGAINKAAAGDTINIAAGTYNERITLTKSLVLIGAGAASTVIDGQASGRVGTVDGRITVTLSDLTIRNGRNGRNYGGGIYNNESMLTLQNSTISGNFASWGGGGIYNNQGIVTVRNSTISGNSTASYGGAGIYTRGGEVTVESSTISSNTADISGGGINNSRGTLTVRNSTVSGNVTKGYGGGIINYGAMTLESSFIIDNRADFWGGGIGSNHNDGSDMVTMTVRNSIISGNSTAEMGGGIYNFSGTAVIENSTIYSNSSSAYGGGIGNAGTITVDNSTIAGNITNDDGGGLGNIGIDSEANAGRATVRNSTISGNSAAGNGGGISTVGRSLAASVTLENSTVSGNSSGNRGGDIYAPVGQVTVQSSILFDCNANSGSLTSRGNNLERWTSCGFTQANDQQGKDPLLGPLADNGGPTKTHALLPGSPAIDASGANCGVATDQRGTPRPQGAACDIGAFEAKGAPTLAGPDHDSALPALHAKLAWTNPPGATQYQLQVVPANNDGPGVNIIRSSESSFTLDAPARGQGNYILLPGMSYQWRVRATSKTGSVSESDPEWGPWSAFKRFRTPQPSSQGLTAAAPPDQAAVGAGPVTLQWDHPSPSLFYWEIQVSGDARFDPDPATATSFVWWNRVHGGATAPLNSWQAPALQAGVYHWRVRPRVQGDGQPVAWGPTWSFTVK